MTMELKKAAYVEKNIFICPTKSFTLFKHHGRHQQNPESTSLTIKHEVLLF